MSDTITVAAPPTTADVAVAVMAAMAAESGVVTDYNVGSQIRTESEAAGSVLEQQAVIDQALAFQAMVYGAFALYGITPRLAVAAVGTVLFTTGSGSNPPPATQNVLISAGTLLATVGGIQFNTTEAVTLTAGATSISAPVAATQGGVQGNVATGSITQIQSGLAYGPLLVSNPAPTTGGLNAETPGQTLARFAAAAAAQPAASPVAIANRVIGVANASNPSETVAYSTCYEPWIVEQQNDQTVVPGYQILVDNGSGAASSGLLSAVSALLNPSPSAMYRDTGVPYTVAAVTPLNGSVVITGTAVQTSMDETLQQLAVAAVQAYQATLLFGPIEGTAYQSEINAAVANAIAGLATGLSVTLNNATPSPVSSLVPTGLQRVIFTSISATFS